MVIGSNVFNFGQFVYHFIAARMFERSYGEFLGKVYYGEVATIISILGLVGIVQLTLGLTVVKFIASEKTKTGLKNLVKWINWWGLCLGAFLGLVFLIATPLLTNFLNIQQPLALYLLSPIIFFFMISTTQRSVLQGELKFGRLVLSFMAEVIIKIVFTIIFIMLGFSVLGAIGAVLIGIVIGFVVTQIYLLPYLVGKRGARPSISPILKYSLPVLMQGLALTSMYSTDLLLVKHFFPPDVAGVYASLAVLGRVVFFGVSPITHTMFPIVARRFSHGQPYHRIFYSSVVMIVALTLGVVIFYKFFPQIPIIILYGESYIVGAPFLWLFGVFMMLLAIAMLFTQFYLSVGRTKIVGLFGIAAVLQMVLIWFIHPSIEAVIQLSILSAALLVLSLFVYFPWHDRIKS